MTSSGDPAVRVSGTASFRIAERLPSHPDATGLLRAFHSEQVDRYGFADPAELSADEYAPPNGVFAVAYLGDVVAGCGGYRWFDRVTHMVEIKRIYVVPASRGHGTGRALLAWLEHHAVQAGAQRAILETGIRNTAALSLFTSAGYQPMDRYVEGRDAAINRAFARPLAEEVLPGRHHFQAVPFQRRMRAPLPPLPTAQALLADVAATPERSTVPGGEGLGTRVQAVPFQCTIRVLALVSPPQPPTAQASVAAVAATPHRLPPPVGVGLATWVQVVPFHWTIKVLGLVRVPLRLSPTAQALVVDRSVTPSRSLGLPAGVGLGTCVQFVPSQCRIRVSLPLVVGSQLPTAQASLAEVALTPLR